MSIKAKFLTFGPYFRSSWQNELLYTKIYHYAAGTSNLLDAWTDVTKTTAAAQPLVADADGVAGAFFDGNYKIVVKEVDGDGSETTLYTWDNFEIRSGPNVLTATAVWNPANLVDGAGETSAAISVPGAVVGNPVLAAPSTVDLQGLTVTAYVKGADEVRVRIQNETGGAIDLASDTWTVRVLQF